MLNLPEALDASDIGVHECNHGGSREIISRDRLVNEWDPQPAAEVEEGNQRKHLEL